jgi:hypothetical protein
MRFWNAIDGTHLATITMSQSFRLSNRTISRRICETGSYYAKLEIQLRFYRKQARGEVPVFSPAAITSRIRYCIT